MAKTVVVDMEEDQLEGIILGDLYFHYWAIKDSNPNPSKYTAKLIKALKRVIEYYGGNVDE